MHFFFFHPSFFLKIRIFLYWVYFEIEKDFMKTLFLVGEPEDEEEAMDDEEAEEPEVYRAVTSRAVRRRGYNPDSQVSISTLGK